MNKIVIIINGTGGSGKDTIVNILKDYYIIKNVSSIDPIREMASMVGYDIADKSPKSRKFLSDLKRIVTEYNNYPNRYMVNHYLDFYDDDMLQILFFHIREPENIAWVKEAIISKHREEYTSEPLKVYTMLIKAPWNNNTYGNHSDDDVEKYNYDFIYMNDKPLDELRVDFMKFFDNLNII